MGHEVQIPVLRAVQLGETVLGQGAETLHNGIPEDLGREWQVVRDGALHDGVDQAQIAQVAGNGARIEGMHLDAAGAHLPHGVVRILEQSQGDDRRLLTYPVDQHHAAGTQLAAPAQGLGGLEALQDFRLPRWDGGG